jgi:hypothetical protein
MTRAIDALAQEVAEHIAGTCNSLQQGIGTVLRHHGLELSVESEVLLEDAINEYLTQHEQYLCPLCNWWTHEGEVMNPNPEEGGEDGCDDCAEEWEDE